MDWRMRSPVIALVLAVALLASAGVRRVAGAPETDIEQLKAQLQAQIDEQVGALKANYEARIGQLEKRIQSLEADNARLQSAVPAPAAGDASSAAIASMERRILDLESTAEKPSPEAQAASRRAQTNAEAIRTLQRQLQAGATETRDIHRDSSGWPVDLERLYDLPRPFEFHGYLRSGFGMNGEGGKIEAFKAPGAGAKYRLGNEADTYGELGLTHNWLRLDDPLKAPYVRTTVMMSYSTDQSFSYESLNNQDQGNDIALRQAFVEAGNVLESLPEIRFWGGQRYYRRHDIHINDFYYLDMSGYGGGVEDVPLGSFGKVALAWIGGSVDNYQTDDGDVAKQSLDLRIYDVPALFGNFTFWLDYSNTQGGKVGNTFNPDGSPLSIQGSSGWAVGLIHRTGGEALFGGYNDFSVQYGTGAAYNFASTLDTSGPNLDDASRFRITDHFTIQPSPRFAIQAVGLYEETEYGGSNSNERWASVGMRPVYYFNDRFSIALETGIDWVKSDPLGTDGHLWKITLAPQISRGGKFFSRPVARAFVTYAAWSEDLKGQVGGFPYENALDGLSYGVQVEAWW
jgi:maltoporin